MTGRDRRPPTTAAERVLAALGGDAPAPTWHARVRGVTIRDPDSSERLGVAWMVEVIATDWRGVPTIERSTVGHNYGDALRKARWAVHTARAHGGTGTPAYPFHPPTTQEDPR